MNYLKIYNNIIEKYNQLNLQKKNGIYLETHHIIPRCVGGKDNISNLINLTAKAHFICHLLLPKIYKNNNQIYNKLYQALFMMSIMKNNFQERHIITSKQYEKIRFEYANFRRNTSQTSESNEKRRQKLLGRKAWNAGLTKETNPILKLIGQKVSNKLKNRIFTNEHRKHLSEAMKMSDKKRGKNNHWYGTKGPMGGKHHTEERNRKMSEWMKLNNPFRGKHHTEESNKKNSDKVKAKWRDPQYRQKILKFHTTKVICIETKIIYANAAIASRMTKIKGISKCCKGEVETAGGFHWKNYDISPV